jgi:arylsulfatase A-like enzyme
METPPNVIYLVLDTVRADHVSGYGYDRETTPAFDAFAERATTFTDAVAQSPWSIPSHASLFTGRYPADHGATTTAPILQDGPTLPELLSAAGYETYAVSPNEYIRPATGFARGFDAFETLSTVTEPAVTADAVAPLANWVAGTPRVRTPIERLFNASRALDATTTDAAPPPTDGLVDQVETYLDRAATPFFLFVNLLDPHLPRSPDPAHEAAFVDDDLEDVAVVTNERAHTFGDHGMGSRATRKLRQLYDADLRTMDDRLDALLSALSSAGALENSLVAVFADHGEHLGEFGLVGHQYSVFDSVVSVPLALQFPDGGPDRVDEQVELRRLYHTILDETGLDSFPERSLASGIGDDAARGAFYTPALDIEALIWDRTVRYDADLMGESLSFARDGDTKLVRFADEEWLFDLPECDDRSLPLDGAPEQRDRLSDRLDAPVD